MSEGFQAGDECFLKGSLERVVVEGYVSTEDGRWVRAEVRRSDGRKERVPVTSLTGSAEVTDAVRFHQNTGLRHPRIGKDSLPF